MSYARALLLIPLAGCGLLQAEQKWPKPETPGGRELPEAMASTGERAALSQKVVQAKEEPATLFAADRSSCQVSAERFKQVIVGTKAWCAWR
jgi:hypothetical protein